MSKKARRHAQEFNARITCSDGRTHIARCDCGDGGWKGEMRATPALAKKDLSAHLSFNESMFGSAPRIGPQVALRRPR